MLGSTEQSLQTEVLAARKDRRGLKLTVVIAVAVVIGVLAYFEVQDVRSTKFVPKRILLDAPEHQEHANLILDVETDAQEKPVWIREAGCTISLPCEGCVALNAHYDGTMIRDAVQSTKVQIQMRLMHGSMRFRQIMRTLRQRKIGVGDLRVECDVTYAYTRFQSMFAPEYSTSHRWSMSELTEMLELQSLDQQKFVPVLRKKASEDMRWSFVRTSSFAPRFRKLTAMHGSIEGNAKLYIPPGTFANTVNDFLRKVDVEINADVNYEEFHSKAFNAGASARGRLTHGMDRYGAVTIRLPVKTSGQVGIPTLAKMMMRAHNAPSNDRSIVVSNQPRSFLGNVLGSTQKAGMKGDMITKASGMSMSELKDLFHREGGRALQAANEITRGVWSVHTSQAFYFDDEEIAVTAHVIGGTPLTGGFSFGLYETSDEEHSESVYVERNGQMVWEAQSTKWVEKSMVNVTTDFLYNEDTKQWSVGYLLQLKKSEKHEELFRVGVDVDYLNKMLDMTVYINETEARNQYTSPNEDLDKNTSHKITVNAEFQDEFPFEFPTFPKTATVVVDLDTDAFPLTTLTYNVADTAQKVEQHRLTLTQATGRMEESANKVLPGILYATGPSDQQVYRIPQYINTSLQFQTTAQVTASIDIDKSSTTKWRVTASATATGACQVQNTQEYQYIAGRLPAGLLTSKAAMCYECNHDDGASESSCSSYTHLLANGANKSDDQCCSKYGGDTMREHSCCQDNPMISLMESIGDLGETHTGDTSFEMDPIQTDDGGNMRIRKPDDDEFPDVTVNVDHENGVFTASASIKVDNEEKANFSFRFSELNDMNLEMGVTEEFVLTASGSAPAAPKDGVIIRALMVEEDHSQIFNALFVEEHDRGFVVISNEGKINLKPSGVMTVNLKVHDDEHNEALELDGGINTTESATSNSISAGLHVESENVKEGSMWLDLSGTTSSPLTWTLDFHAKNKSEDEVLKIDSTMSRVGDFYTGDIWIKPVDENGEWFNTAFSTGFLPMTTPVGHDRFDMNISLGPGGQGIEDVNGNFAWFVERGPAPVRGVSKAGFSVGGSDQSDNFTFASRTEFGIPYQVAVDTNKGNVGSVTTFEAALEMDNVEDFDATKFAESVAEASGVAAGAVEVVSTQYAAEVGYEFPAAVTEQQAKTAIAAAAQVDASAVTVTILNRRLNTLSSLGDFRKLQGTTTSVKATIAAADVNTLNAVHTRVADTAAVKSGLTSAGVTVASVTVATPPKKKVTVNTKIISEGGTPPIPPPSEESLSTRLSDKLGTTVKSSVGEVQQGATETVTTTPPTASTSVSGNSGSGGGSTGGGSTNGGGSTGGGGSNGTTGSTGTGSTTGDNSNSTSTDGNPVVDATVASAPQALSRQFVVVLFALPLSVFL